MYEKGIGFLYMVIYIQLVNYCNCISSAIDYHFPLCLIIGILLLIFARPWARYVTSLAMSPLPV